VGKVNDPEEMGMIPRLCREIFSRICDNRENQELEYIVEVKLNNLKNFLVVSFI
jgi:hypothetical protein